jgi:6-phosphogluconolactonase
LTPTVEIVADAAASVAAGLVRLRDALAGTAREHVVCLSGGETPQPFYAALADEIRAGRLSPARIHWVIGDERAVPFDHPRSNFGMIRRILLEPAGIPAERIHAMPGPDADLKTAALVFERRLQTLYGAPQLAPDRPLFDFILLGLGEDGHVASLFPGADALNERQRWVLPTRAPDGEARLSLTLPVLDSARHVVAMVMGPGKHDALAAWRRGDAGIPASRLNPPGGVTVLADRDAVGA